MASLDNLYVLASVFFLAIVFVVGNVIWDNVAAADQIFEHNSVSQSIRDDAQGFYSGLDVMFVLFFFALHLGILILAFFLRSHPIIYIASILIIAILAVFAAPLSNAYETFVSDPGIAPHTLTMTTYLMTNLPMIEVIFGFLTVIVLAGLARAEGVF